MTSVYDRITSFESLYEAMRKCRLGVMWKDSTARYVTNGLVETHKLRKELLNGTYRIRPYNNFVITDPKRRIVMAMHLRDRQYQRSICDNYLYDQITKGFIRDNYACQKGRGMDDALNRMDAHLHRYYRKHGADGWVLKCDVRKYFPSTLHSVAKAAVAKRVPDEHVRKAVFDVIDSFGGDRGIGLGSQISQLIQLAVLDDMDHTIKEIMRVKHYLRYMDDFVLIHHDKEFLKECLARIRSILADLGLELNEKTSLFPLKQGIRWLQWRFVLTPTGKVIRLQGKKSVHRERRKLRNMRRRGLSIDKARESLQAWIASAKRGNTRRRIADMIKYFETVYAEPYMVPSG